MQKYSLSRSIYGTWTRRYLVGSILMLAAFVLVAIQMGNIFRGRTYWNTESPEFRAPFIASPEYSIFLSIFIAAAATVASVLCFSYMKKMRSTSMVHSLPIRRETIFLSVTAAGLTLLFVPILLGGGIFSLVQIFNKIIAPGTVSHWIFFSLAVALFYFGVSSFVGMLTGNSVAQFVFTLLFINIPILLELFVISRCQQFIFGFYYDDSVTMGWNPIYAMINYLIQVYGDYTLAQPGNSWTPLALAVAGIVFLVFALLLYRVRQLERAGDIITFRGVQPVFRIGLALLLAVIFSSLARYSLPYWPVLLTELVFGILGGVLGYTAADMMVRRSLRVLRTVWKGAVAFAVVYGLLLFGLSFDLTGYASYTLKADDVYMIAAGDYDYVIDLALTKGKRGYDTGRMLEVGVKDAGGYLKRADQGDTSRMPTEIMYQILDLEPTSFKEGAGFDAALQLQQYLAENADYLQNTYHKNMGEYYYIPVRALLKNGTVFEREYTFYLGAGQQEEIVRLRDNMYQQNGMAEDLFQLHQMKDAEFIMVEFYDGTITDLSTISLDQKEWGKVYAALEKDVVLRDGLYGPYRMFDSAVQQTPVFSIQPWRNGGATYVPYLSVYAADKNTLDCLIELGILTRQDVRRIESTYS